MKLLNWMRVKIKQTNTDPLKEFVTGSYGCLRSNSCSASNQNTKLVTLPNHVYQNSFSESDRSKAEEKLEEDEISFAGFLAIGTLGAETPATPKLFDVSLEEEGSQENKEDITKDELKLISDKLEMFLQSEAQQGYNELTVRKSNLSGLGEFSDNASFKTEGSNAEEYGEPVLTKINREIKEKKGSIAELFQRKKSAEKASCTEKHEHERRDPIKDMMRKLHGSPKKSFASCSKDDYSVPKKKKLRKIGQIFRRKIHPVIYTAESEDNTPNKDHKIEDMFPNRSYNNGDPMCRHGGDNEVSRSRESFLISGSSSDTPEYEVVGKSPNGKREKWIKTDAEYLVLEL